MRHYSILFVLLLFLPGCSKDENGWRISTKGADAESVYLTTNDEDRPVIAWTEQSGDRTRFYYAEISGNFDSSQIVEVPVPEEISTHAEGMPKVAFKSNGTVIAAYETKSPTRENKYAGAIFFTESMDEGKTWSAPLYIHSDTISGRSRSFFDIERLENGEVGAAWLDIKLNKSRGGRSIRFARTNIGSGFTNEILVDSSACECCRIDLYSAGQGSLSISYRGLSRGMMDQPVRDIMHRFN